MSASNTAVDLKNVHVLLEELLDVFDVYKDVLRANTVDFYTENRIDLLQRANPLLLDEMMKLSTDGLVRLACGEFVLEEEQKQNLFPHRDTAEEIFPEVCKLSQQSHIRCERLEHEGESFHSNAAKFSHSLELRTDTVEDVLVKPKEFMNLKKSHEVAEMSQLCSSLIQSQKVKKVIDIGSGKGYLSQYLTLQFGVRVIGIDSSDTNTHGAKERGRKLAKHWKAFIRRAAAESQQNCLKTSTNVEQSKQSSCLNKDHTVTVEASKPDTLPDTLPYDHNTCQSFISTSSTSGVQSQDCLSKVPNLSSLAKDAMMSTKASADDRTKPHHRNKYTDLKTHESRFEPVTAFVSSATDLESLAGSSDATEEDTFSNDPFLLVGLHTCGDLGSTVTRLFVDSALAVAMCFVPCCYHFVSEEFEPTDSKFWIQPSEPDQWGFPLSQYLRDKRVNIGRDAKMLACMAQERMAADGKIPVRSLFFRAVLQVLLKERYRVPLRQEAVGKLANKCRNFVEYTRRAMKKLGFDHEKMTDQEIDQYHIEYLEKMKLLEIFAAARLAFSRTVESLLLLDKLCFLMEQPQIESASIVRLFDPIQSPRCYAVVATKKTVKM